LPILSQDIVIARRPDNLLSIYLALAGPEIYGPLLVAVPSVPVPVPVP
jgi:hypothetical protein